MDLGLLMTQLQTVENRVFLISENSSISCFGSLVEEGNSRQCADLILHISGVHIRKCLEPLVSPPSILLC